MKKFISWNVNGLRAVMNKGFEDFKKVVLQKSSVRAKPATTNKEDIRKIVKNSFETINTFNPKAG